MKTLFILLLVAIAISACQKEHSEYRFTPKFHKGDLVQYRKDIEHDYVNWNTGKRLWDIPQPFKIDSFYYNSVWRDNWYFVIMPSGVRDSSGIDELLLQKWNGHLEK